MSSKPQRSRGKRPGSGRPTDRHPRSPQVRYSRSRAKSLNGKRRKSKKSANRFLIIGSALGCVTILGLLIGVISYMVSSDTDNSDSESTAKLQENQNPDAFELDKQMLGNFLVKINANYIDENDFQHIQITSQPQLKVQRNLDGNYKVSWFGETWQGSGDELRLLKLRAPARKTGTLLSERLDLLADEAQVVLQLAQDGSAWNVALTGRLAPTAARVEKEYFFGASEVKKDVPIGTEIIHVVQFNGARGKGTHREKVRPLNSSGVVTLKPMHTYKLREMAHSLRADPQGVQSVEFHIPASPGFSSVDFTLIDEKSALGDAPEGAAHKNAKQSRSPKFFLEPIGDKEVRQLARVSDSRLATQTESAVGIWDWQEKTLVGKYDQSSVNSDRQRAMPPSHIQVLDGGNNIAIMHTGRVSAVDLWDVSSLDWVRRFGQPRFQGESITDVVPQTDQSTFFMMRGRYLPGTIRVVERKDGQKQAQQKLMLHALDVSKDRQFAIARTHAKAFVIQDLQDGSELMRLPIDDIRNIDAVFLPTRGRIAVVSQAEDRQSTSIDVIDLPDNKVVQTIKLDRGYRSPKASSSGEHLVVQSRDGFAVVDLAKSCLVRHLPVGRWLGFAPHSSLAVLATGRGQLSLIDLRDGSEVEVLKTPGELSMSVEFVDTQHIAAALKDGRVAIWELAKPIPETVESTSIKEALINSTLQKHQHVGSVRIGTNFALKVLLDDRRSKGIAVLDDFSLVSFESATQEVLGELAQFSSLRSSFDQWAISGNGELAVTAVSSRKDDSYISKLTWFDLKTNTQVDSWDVEGKCVSLELDYDGQQIAGVTENRTFARGHGVFHVNIKTKETETHTIEFSDHPQMSAFDFARNRVYIAAIGKPLSQFELSTGKSMPPVGPTEINPAGVALSPNAKHLILAPFHETELVVLDAVDLTVKQRMKGHSGGQVRMGFSSDSKRLVTLTADNVARTWTIPTGESGPTVKTDRARSFMSSDSTVGFWVDDESITTGNQLWVTTANVEQFNKRVQAKIKDRIQADPGLIVTHANLANAVDVTPDNQMIVAAFSRGVKLFNLSSGREQRHISMNSLHPNPVKIARVSPDGTRLLTSCEARGPGIIITEDRSKFGAKYTYNPAPRRCGIWDLETNALIAEINVPNPRVIGYSDDGLSFAVLSHQDKFTNKRSAAVNVHVFDSQTLKELSRFSIPGGRAVYSLTKDYLHVGFGTVFCSYAIADGKLSMNPGRESYATATAIDPFGQLGMAAINSRVQLVTVATGKAKSFNSPNIHHARITRNKICVFISEDKLFTVPAKSPKSARSFACGPDVTNLLISRDGSLAIVGRNTGCSVFKVE